MYRAIVYSLPFCMISANRLTSGDFSLEITQNLRGAFIGLVVNKDINLSSSQYRSRSGGLNSLFEKSQARFKMIIPPIKC